MTLLSTVRNAFCAFFDEVNKQVIPPVPARAGMISDEKPFVEWMQQPPPPPPPKVSWTRASPMHIPRVGFGIVHAANRAFVVGGLVPAYDASGTTQQGWAPIGAVEVLSLPSDDPHSWFWEVGVALPNPRAFTALVHYRMGDEDVLIAIGGSSFRKGRMVPSPVVESFSIRQNTWMRRNDMPSPRIGHTASTYNDLVYVIGGLPGENDSTQYHVQVYDPVKDAWSTLKMTSPYVYSHTATSIPGKGILVAGGIENSQNGFDPSPSSSAWMFDPAGNTFVPLRDLPFGSHGASATLWGNDLAIVAGGLSKLGALNATQGYHIPTGTWRIIPDLPTPRIGLGLVAARGHIAAVGGASLPHCPRTQEEDTPAISRRSYDKHNGGLDDIIRCVKNCLFFNLFLFYYTIYILLFHSSAFHRRVQLNERVSLNCQLKERYQSMRRTMRMVSGLPLSIANARVLRKSMASRASRGRFVPKKVPCNNAYAASAAEAGQVSGQGAGVVNKVKQMDKDFKYNGWHMLRWGGFALLGAGSCGMYLYRDEVTELTWLQRRKDHSDDPWRRECADPSARSSSRRRVRTFK